MTVPAEPLYIGGRGVFLKFYVMPRNADDPRRIEGNFTLVGPEGILTLDAIVGPQGVPGEPSPIIRPEWGSTVTDPADLPDTATLDESDSGRAWYIDGQWHVYDDDSGDYQVIEGSIPGPPGNTPDISVSAELIDADSPPVFGPIEVVESGTSIAPNFHIKVPAVPGPEGPASAIELASDYDDSTSSQVGDFLIKVDEDHWGPASPALLSPKMYTIPHDNFLEYNGSAGRQLIASLNIPAQDFPWYPDVAGHVRIQRGFLSSAQIEIEVRIGNTGIGTGESEPLCGLAPYDPAFLMLDAIMICHILPHFSDISDPLRSVSPDTSVARVPVGQAKTIYVFAHRLGGSGSYQFTKSTAQLRINVQPVNSA